jgi:hypothetical protein
MGLFRIYSARPTMIPKGDVGLDAAVDAPTLDHDLSVGSSQIVTGLPSPEIGPDNLSLLLVARQQGSSCAGSTLGLILSRMLR